MSERSLVAKLSSAQRQLGELQARAAGRPGDFAADLEALRDQLVDLEVAYEELEQQKEELETTREALERQRHRYLSLFNEAPFGYLVTSLRGTIEEANLAAAALLDIDPALLVGRPLALHFTGEDRDAFQRVLSRASAGQLSGEAEVRIRRRDQETCPAMLTAVLDAGERDRAARLRWAIRDVSRTKAVEEELRAAQERLRHAQRLEAVGRLAGGIAHSFNNLLAAIAFQCELLEQRLDEGDERRAYVEEIEKAGERAATLARQLLAFGRKQVLQPRVLCLNEVIREMEPMLRRLIGEHIRLEIRPDPANGAVHADLGQIEQVILNLAVNARDSMPSGGTLLLAAETVEIVAGQRSDLPPGHYVQLTVADTGVGIAPEVMEHLFEPFFTTKERGRGTGLGLATVHGIVHQSGGHIRVESDAGKGSRFVVLLPRSAEAAESLPKALPRSGRRGRRGSEVVLLVEDEDNIREPATEILQSRGYEVLAAGDAGQALSLSEGHRGPIHILVTDVVMPGISGSQLAEQLSRRRPEMRVLYISGYPEDSIAHHGVLNPEQHFLQKPFPPGRFLDKVREVLDGQAAAVAAGGGDG